MSGGREDLERSIVVDTVERGTRPLPRRLVNARFGVRRDMLQPCNEFPGCVTSV